MTTIAWDGKTLAADRRVNFGGVSDGQTTKIVKNKKGHLCVAAGSSSLGAAFKRWFLAGEKGEPPSLVKGETTASGAIIRKPGVIEIYDQDGWYEIETERYANGSGWEIALGAMKVGATAEQAVRAAIELDGYSGNGVDVLELGK